MATGQTEKCPRRGSPGRPPFHDNQRDRVISCAAELFACEGFENVGMERLAEAVGISKAGIYHYFRAKHEILDAIVVTTLDGLVEAVTASIKPTRTPRERLVSFMAAHAAYSEANYWAFTAMLVGFGGIRSPAMRGAIVEQRDRYESLLRQIIADGIASGDFRPVDLATTARAALLDGIGARRHGRASRNSRRAASRAEARLDARTTCSTSPAAPPGSA